MSGRLRVDAGGRWDAIELLRALSDRHAYLIQDGSSHWELYLECEPAEIEECLRMWLVRRSLGETCVWLEDGTRVVVAA